MTNDSEQPGGLNRFGSAAPPPELESRVIRSLQSRGALRNSRRATHRLLRFAAALMLFVAGFASAKLANRAAADDSTPRYALLLYDGDRPSVDDVAEMREWIFELRERGHHVSGEKLGNQAIAGDPAVIAPAGFIIVSANSPEEAIAIARSMPHQRHGGRVVIRPIDRT